VIGAVGIAGGDRRSRRTARRPRLSSARGFTLIELLMTLLIVALITGGAVRGFRSLAKSDLRAGTAHLSGAIRYLFDRASTTGKYHRLVLDINEGRYWAEVSDDKFYVPREAESQFDRRRREEEEAKQDVEEKRKLEKREEALKGGRYEYSGSFDPSKIEMGDFKPKRARFGAFKETALKPVTLKKGSIKIAGVYTPRQTDEVVAGRAYIYFFPMGQTEPAIVHLSDPEGNTVYSIVVHPITGRTKIYNEYVKPPTGLEFDDEGNRIER
jgi:general secretion pathway protein H